MVGALAGSITETTLGLAAVPLIGAAISVAAVGISAAEPAAVRQDRAVAEAARQFIVDGETFRVRLHEDGGFDCEWLSGPNAGYGFGSGAPAAYTAGSTDEPVPNGFELPAGRASDDRVRDGIRGFLAMIDPDTGFIGD